MEVSKIGTPPFAVLTATSRREKRRVDCNHCRTRWQSYCNWSWNRAQIVHPRWRKVLILCFRSIWKLDADLNISRSVSEVTVTLRNEGFDAYKPDVYGKKILITRRFAATGSSSYKLCTEKHVVVSNRKVDLDEICDHMDIQVDNPLNILTQGSWISMLSVCSKTNPVSRCRKVMKHRAFNRYVYQQLRQEIS